MQNTFTKLFLCATIGALFSGPLHAKEVEPTSITVLLRATITSLESQQQLPKRTSAALHQLEQIAPRLNAIFPVPMTFSADEIAAMERHNLTRYYAIDTSGKSNDAVNEMLADLRNNPLVESAQVAPELARQDENFVVAGVPKTDAKQSTAGSNATPDYTSRQLYMQDATSKGGFKLGGLNAIAARAYPGGDGEYVRIISTEWNHWSYDHADLPRPFLQHGEVAERAPNSHATMSAGIMFSKDNGFGTTGFVPKAQAGYSKFSQPGGGSLFNLGQHLQPGDVVQVGIHFGPPLPIPIEVCDKENRYACFLPIESVQSVADEISYLTQEKGVHVIIAAGNGNINLDHAYFKGRYDRNLNDTGAIYAGAANPGSGQRASFSEYGSRVDLFSWGGDVTTTSCSGKDCSNDIYSHTFSGTSSSNPIIAGAVAQVQSIAFAHGLGAISPKKMRQVLVDTGHPLPSPDAQRPIGMQPDVQAAVELLLNKGEPPVDIDVPEAVVKADIHAVSTTSTSFAYQLDGSKSQNATTYQWKMLSGPFSLRHANKAIAEAVVNTHQTGESIYQLTITNKKGVQSSSTMKVSVVATNVEIVGPTSIVQGQAANLKAAPNFKGEAGTPPVYNWKIQDATGAGVLQGAQQELTLSTLAAGSYQVTIDVSSSHGGRKAHAEQKITVKKSEESRPPVVVVSGPTQATSGTSVKLDAAGSSAADGGKLAYSWKVSPPLAFIADGAQLTFTAPTLAQETQYHFTVTANDGKLSAQKNHTVIVKADDVAPIPVEECKPLWKQSQSYQGADMVQHNGRIYLAMWHSQREPGDPAYTDTINQGWGFEWADRGACNH